MPGNTPDGGHTAAAAATSRGSRPRARRNMCGTAARIIARSIRTSSSPRPRNHCTGQQPAGGASMREIAAASNETTCTEQQHASIGSCWPSRYQRAIPRKHMRAAAVDRQSGPRPDSRHLRQPALEGLTNSAQTETPRQADRNKSDHGKRRRHTAAQGGDGFLCGNHESSTCVTLNGSGIQLAVGPQPLPLRNHNFGLAQRIMVKRLATSRHDPLDSIGYPRMRASCEFSTMKHRLLHASRSHPIPPPNDPNPDEAQFTFSGVVYAIIRYDEDMQRRIVLTVEIKGYK
ncbi:hypothetical protein F511_25284 [Dorcoceras hygrometricum]|uniref:Uncharacterized protein n=1 Tax=Dorcoceras hygrometricum TaxID=472368 RepID=A0A2Z7APL1_9LAMI|nr:hypothetical protein F511_25284 [Dorcoceras hygrometricum]